MSCSFHFTIFLPPHFGKVMRKNKERIKRRWRVRESIIVHRAQVRCSWWNWNRLLISFFSLLTIFFSNLFLHNPLSRTGSDFAAVRFAMTNVCWYFFFHFISFSLTIISRIIFARRGPPRPTMLELARSRRRCWWRERFVSGEWGTKVNLRKIINPILSGLNLLTGIAFALPINFFRCCPSLSSKLSGSS